MSILKKQQTKIDEIEKQINQLYKREAEEKNILLKLMKEICVKPLLLTQIRTRTSSNVNKYDNSASFLTYTDLEIRKFIVLVEDNKKDFDRYNDCYIYIGETINKEKYEDIYSSFYINGSEELTSKVNSCFRNVSSEIFKQIFFKEPFEFFKEAIQDKKNLSLKFLKAECVEKIPNIVSQYDSAHIVK